MRASIKDRLAAAEEQCDRCLDVQAEMMWEIQQLALRLSPRDGDGDTFSAVKPALALGVMVDDINDDHLVLSAVLQRDGEVAMTTSRWPWPVLAEADATIHRAAGGRLDAAT